MTWLRVESSVARNSKFLKAGPAASWLWLCGLAYCQEGLTDGLIPPEAIDHLGVRDARRLAAKLVESGLWEAHDDGGWRVHDYLKHNRSAAEVRAIQQERREAGARGGSKSWQGRSANSKQSAEAKRQHVAEANEKRVLNPSTSTDQISTATTTEEEQKICAEPDGSTPAVESPTVLEFPTQGNPNVYRLSERQVSEWSELFPALDVVAQSRQALAWVRAHPGRQKTARGMPKFLVAWFTRAVDTGRVTPIVAGSRTSGNVEAARRFLERKAVND